MSLKWKECLPILNDLDLFSCCVFRSLIITIIYDYKKPFRGAQTRYLFHPPLFPTSSPMSRRSSIQSTGFRSIQIFLIHAHINIVLFFAYLNFLTCLNKHIYSLPKTEKIKALRKWNGNFIPSYVKCISRILEEKQGINIFSGEKGNLLVCKMQ